jgi:predicted deacetylase
VDVGARSSIHVGPEYTISEEVLGLIEASSLRVFESMKKISVVDIENLKFE